MIDPNCVCLSSKTCPSMLAAWWTCSSDLRRHRSNASVYGDFFQRKPLLHNGWMTKPCQRWTSQSRRCNRSWYSQYIQSMQYPPPRKYYENNSPRIFWCNFGGRLRQNRVITKKLIPQEFFCVIGDRRDLRLVHVELREIYVNPKKIFLGEFFCAIDYAELSQWPRK